MNALKKFQDEFAKSVNLTKEQMKEVQKAFKDAGQKCKTKCIEVNYEGETFEFTFVRPSRKIVGMYNDQLMKKQSIEAYNEGLIKATLLNGRDIVFEEDEIFTVLIPHIPEIITSAVASVKN